MITDIWINVHINHLHNEKVWRVSMENITLLKKSLEYVSELTEKTKLVDAAKDKLRNHLLQNNEFKFDLKDEQTYLKELEYYDFNHFYVKSVQLERDIQIVTNQVLDAIHKIYGTKPHVKIMLVDNPAMKRVLT